MLDVLIRRDRAITLTGLAALTLLSWLWLFRTPMHHAHSMHGERPMTSAMAESGAAAAPAPMEASAPAHGADPGGDGEELPPFP